MNKRVLTLLAMLGVGCDRDSASLGYRVEWLDVPMGVPEEVRSLRVTIVRASGETRAMEVGVAELGDANDDGRPDARLSDLPTGEPLSIRVEGKDDIGKTTHIGQARVVLEPSESRVVELRMIPRGAPVDIQPPTFDGFGRVFATATRLDDGRVLIAGGLSEETIEAAECPDGEPSSATRLCFRGTATTHAMVFDPATATFAELPARMFNARAGHTATKLTDGRVIVAGGAKSLDLVFSKQLTGENDWRLSISAGAREALNAIEVFEPESNSSDRVSRGSFGFLGGIETPRYLHGAALAPSDGTTVVLIGGVGSAASSSWDVLLASPMTTGIAHGRATFASASPVVATIRGSNAGVAVLRTAYESSGLDTLVASWSAVGASAGVLSQTPALAQDSQPSAAELFAAGRASSTNAAQTAIATVGWYGLPCNEAGDFTFPLASSSGIRICDAANDRNALIRFDVEGRTSATLFTTSVPRAFAPSTLIDDGTFIVFGGVTNLQWQASSTMEVVTFDVDRATATSPEGDVGVRTFGASASLAENGALVFGGATMTLDPLGARVELSSSGSVVFIDPER